VLDTRLAHDDHVCGDTMRTEMVYISRG
jgi:hypothetical protein